MPQLDPTWFASQLFWLAICMTVLYTALSQYILPRLLSVIDARTAAARENLLDAESFRREASVAQQHYELAMAEARARAQKVYAEAEAANKETMERGLANLTQTLASHTSIADKRIAAKQRAVILELQPAAAELTALAVRKLTGLEVDTASAIAAVKQHMGHSA